MIKANLPIGLIRQQKDGMTVFRGSLPQQLCQSLQRFLCINYAGGVVGGVDQHRTGRRAQHFLESLEINLEIRELCRHHTDIGTGGIDIRNIFREKGCKDDYFLPRHCHSPQGMSQCTCRTGNRKDMSCFIIHIKSLI